QWEVPLAALDGVRLARAQHVVCEPLACTLGFASGIDSTPQTIETIASRGDVHFLYRCAREHGIRDELEVRILRLCRKRGAHALRARDEIAPFLEHALGFIVVDERERIGREHLGLAARVELRVAVDERCDLPRK